MDECSHAVVQSTFVPALHSRTETIRSTSKALITGVIVLQVPAGYVCAGLSIEAPEVLRNDGEFQRSQVGGNLAWWARVLGEEREALLGTVVHVAVLGKHNVERLRS